MDLTDHAVALLERARAGDTTALERLFERCYPRVLRFVHLRLSAELRDAVESVDIVQQTFLEAWRDFARANVVDEAHLVRWLARVAENEIRDESRRAHALRRDVGRNRAFESLSERCGSDALERHAARTIELPSDAAERNEERERLEAAISALSDELREVVRLRDVTGATWADVAHCMGLRTERAARCAHARALDELAEQLGAPC